MVLGPTGATIVTAEGECRETYGYEGARLSRVEFDAPGVGGARTVGTHVVEYGVGGEIETVRTRYTNGYETVNYARPRRFALKKTLAVVEDGLVAAIPGAISPAVAQAGDVFAVALAYSFAGPPLPPIVGLLTAAEHAGLSEGSGDAWDAWNPAEYRLFDVAETALALGPSVAAACDVLNTAAPGHAKKIRAMLNRVAARLNALPWSSSLVVFATDLEGVDVADNLRASVAPERLAALADAGRSLPG